MNLADDPGISAQTHDLARAITHDHLIGMLAYMAVCGLADRQGRSLTDVAKAVREGVLGAWQDGNRTVPPEFIALIRAHTAKVMDHVVDMCATTEALRGVDVAGANAMDSELQGETDPSPTGMDASRRDPF